MARIRIVRLLVALLLVIAAPPQVPPPAGGFEGVPRPHQRFRRRRFRPIRQTAAPPSLQRLTMRKTTRRRRFRQANYSPQMARCAWTAQSPAQ